MPITLLSDGEREALERQELTYTEVGASLGDASLPAGFHHLRATRTIGEGPDALTRAGDALLSWRIHAGAGFDVAAGSPLVAVGTVVRLRRRLPMVPMLRVAGACRVVRVVDADTARGFAYGTLPGHPERGEESFVVRMSEDGRVDATIVAFSVPTASLARAAGALGRRVQRRATTDCLDALAAAV